LAHSRSALKRWRQSLQQRDRNRSVKSRTRTLLAKALAAVDGDPASAEEAVRAAVSSLDRAAQKGVIHTNAAARGKARLLKRFNLATAGVVAAAAQAAAPAEAPKAPRRRGLAAPAATKRATKAAAKEKPAPKRPPRGRAAPKAEEKPAPRSRARKS
jgi:small subunit ribosomal protein S20